MLASSHECEKRLLIRLADVVLDPRVDGVFVACVSAKFLDESSGNFDAHDVQFDSYSQLRESRADVLVLRENRACIAFARPEQRWDQEVFLCFEMQEQARLEVGPDTQNLLLIVGLEYDDQTLQSVFESGVICQ